MSKCSLIHKLVAATGNMTSLQTGQSQW